MVLSSRMAALLVLIVCALFLFPYTNSQSSKTTIKSATSSVQAGTSTTMVVTIENFPLFINVSDTFKLTLESNTWDMNGATCTFPFRSGSQWIANSDVMYAVATSTFSSGSTLTISCKNTIALKIGYTANSIITSPIIITNSHETVTIDSYYVGSTIIAPLLGRSPLPAVDLTPEGKMMFKFTSPSYLVPEGDKFIVSMESAYCDSAQPRCTFHTMSSPTNVVMDQDPAKWTQTAAEAYLATSGNIENCQVSIIIPTQIGNSKSYAFFCDGFNIPLTTSSALAAGGIFSDKFSGYRALDKNFAIPVLKDQVGDKLFNIQLKEWTAGVITTMTVNILRFPIELTQGAIISFTMPKQYLFIQDGTASCKLQQQKTYQDVSNFKEITSTYSIDDNLVAFMIGDSDPLTQKYAITQITCNGVVALASHPAINNITLNVYEPGVDMTTGTPKYTRKDGSIAQVYPGTMGTVENGVSQSNNVAGALTKMVIDVVPANVGMRQGDYLALIPDPGYAFTGTSSCTLQASNPNTSLLSSGGDMNIAITTKFVNVTNTTQIYTFNFTESSKNKLTMLSRVDTQLKIICDGVQNPRKEKLQQTTLDLRVYDPLWGIESSKAQFSAAILPTINPAPLGLVQAIYQPSSARTNQIVTLNIIINALSNNIPSTTSSDAGSIVFTVPSSWTPNASGNTQCTCNRIGCTGTTTVDRTLDYQITFRPAAEVPVQDEKGSNIIIFSCTNFKTPSTPQNAINTLKINTMSSSARIDSTDRGYMPEITLLSNSNTQAEVVHTLIFNMPRLFSTGELSVLQSAYQKVFASQQITASIIKQSLRSGQQFSIPALWTNSSDSSIVNLAYNLNANGLDDGDTMLFNTMRDDDENTSLSTTQTRVMHTYGIDDIYQFTSSSKVVIVATKLTTAQNGMSQADMIRTMDTSLSRQTLSTQLQEFLAVEPIYKYSGLNTDGVVYPDHCFDGILSGDERDVDCGGSCAKCPVGSKCKKSGDCSSRRCSSGICRNEASLSAKLSIMIVILSVIVNIYLMFNNQHN